MHRPKRQTFPSSSILSWIIAASIGLMPVVYYISLSAGVALQLVFLSVVLFSALYAFCNGLPFLQLITGFAAVAYFFVTALLSVVLNPESYPLAGDDNLAVVNIINASLLLLVGVFYAAEDTDKKLRDILPKVAVITALFLTMAMMLHWGERVGDRFSGREIHPNWWGSIAYGSACCAVFMRNRKASYAVIGVAITMCLAASSRGSLLGILVLVALSNIYLLKNRKFIRTGLTFIPVLTLVIAVTPLGKFIVDFFSSAFELNNPYRGTDSGFTGRADLWYIAWDYFQMNPAFGAGYGYLYDVHNGFLISLGETGLFGFAFILVSILATVFSSKVALPQKAVLISYCVFILFAPRLINLVLGSMVPSLMMVQGVTRSSIKLPRRGRHREKDKLVHRLRPDQSQLVQSARGHR